MKEKKLKIFKNIFLNHQESWWFGCYTPAERRTM